MRFLHVAVGGTFDRLHTGHVALLTRAVSEGSRVTIGVTTDKYVRQYKGAGRVDEENISGVSCCRKTGPQIQPYKERKKQLNAWIRRNGLSQRVAVVPIDDGYGPAVGTTSFDAIVVSRETEPMAKKINAARIKQGSTSLTVIVIPTVIAEDLQAVSSTRIRNGEIDREGKLILPDILRKTLTKPIGTLIPDQAPVPVSSAVRYSISVGDTTTAALLSKGIIPTLAVIDFQARRQEFDWERGQWDALTLHRHIMNFTSGPGFINKQVMMAMERWAEQPEPTLFVINGEEDLLVLPAILYAPIGSMVYYGQPEKGIVQVPVTSDMKKHVQTLLSQFTSVQT